MTDTRADFPAVFLDKVGKPLIESESLKDHSNFRIGGRASYFFEASTIQELVTSILLVRSTSMPYFLIGGGNNLLFDDDGFPGLIIKNAAAGKERRGETEIETFSGSLLSDVLQFSMNEELAGFEFLAGIPGTIGGAVFGNAGAFDQSIGDFLKEALIFNQKGKQVRVKRDYFEFGYRQSTLKKRHEVLLQAVFELGEGEKEKIKARVEGNLKVRREKHPPEGTAYPGSYFKNVILPDGKKVPAGYYLERVGAKNMREGGALVYPGHANFIINQGNASAQDVCRLAQELKRRVKEEFGIELEEEVIFLRADFSLP
jgi:UDP-N-acetylmuramate dehydrogenase